MAIEIRVSVLGASDAGAAEGESASSEPPVGSTLPGSRYRLGCRGRCHEREYGLLSLGDVIRFGICMNGAKKILCGVESTERLRNAELFAMRPLVSDGP